MLSCLAPIIPSCFLTNWPRSTLLVWWLLSTTPASQSSSTTWIRSIGWPRKAGFVWRLQSESGNATDIAYNDDKFVIVNMSVWESVEALKEFIYHSRHVEVFRDRLKWFEKMSAPNYCLWWVPAGHRPSVAEGRERLEHYQKHGSTPYSFWFKQEYPAPVEEFVSA
jgi:hypothetical protein